MDGLEDGVGMELVVLVVALVPILLRPSVETESLDCGRRMPVGITLCDRALGALLLLPVEEGESIEEEDMGRNAVGAEGGLDVRRRSFSLSLIGDGESSMIRTHPDVSAPPGVVALPGVLFSASKSPLCLRDFGIVANRSSRECEDEDVDGAGEAEAFTGTGGGGIALAALRLVTLPMRSRGTRV